MAQIYISSSYADLKPYREAVYRQLTKLAGHQVVAMEDYVASDDRPLAKCLADVESCDVYVGIFAWRYGSVPKADNPGKKSITELEYRHASSKNKTCLLFLLEASTPWNPQFTDSMTKDNEAGARIEALRTELPDGHLVNFFDTPDKLASLVSAAVQVWEKKASPAAGQAPASVDAQPLFRELRNSLLLAHAPQDEELARSYAAVLGVCVDKPVLLSPTALYARDEASFAALESSAIRCAGGLVLVTPAALAPLKDAGARVPYVLSLLRARLGPIGAMLCGATAGAVPGAWELAQVFELPTPAPEPTGPQSPELTALRAWLDSVLPPWGSRTIGLPISVLSMTAPEFQALKANPSIVGDRLGNQVQKQFEAITEELAAAKIPWGERYAAERDGWQPFGPNDTPIASIVEDIARDINERMPAKLRHRRIKTQWYPFDALKSQFCDNDTRLRRVYREMARTGCVLLVDELSLFHPDLNEAFRNSPFFNNEQVAMVTLSPFDPQRRQFDQLLEVEARRKLAGAFERYANEYDPQCELAVSDPRRLKRWLHSSLPETVTNLREPRPDQEVMRAFYAAELGTDLRPRTGDYPWGGGAQR